MAAVCDTSGRAEKMRAARQGAMPAAARPHRTVNESFERSCLVSKGKFGRWGSNGLHSSKSHKNLLGHAARPIVEGLENRWLLSGVGTADRAYTIGLL